MQICKNLRWKGYHGTAPTLEALYAELSAHEVPTECLKTGMALGPDGGPVFPDHCCGDRPCYVASKRFRATAPTVT